MIDRTARDHLAFGLRQLAVGNMTNDEFDDEVFEPCYNTSDYGDGALRELATYGWLHYSDHRKYRLRGWHALSPEERRSTARAVLFLKTDQEYVFEDALSEGTILGRGCSRLAALAFMLAIAAGLVTWWTLGVFWIGIMIIMMPLFSIYLCMLIVQVVRDRLRRRAAARQREAPSDSFWPYLDERANEDVFRFWPFENADAYAEALAEPPYLCGVRQPS